MQNKRLYLSSSAALIGGNHDLLLQILILLPAKSLLRFKLVCKHWRSLISDESFQHLHRRNQHRRRPLPQLILHSTAWLQLFICDLAGKTLAPLPLNDRHVRVLQSSHGLLLLDCRKFPQGRRDICVYNPATGQCRKLLDGIVEKSSRFCLMCDDPSESDHYRVFNFVTYHHALSTTINVYDSRTQQWQWQADSREQLRSFPEGVVCNGRLYFIRYSQQSLCFSPGNGNGNGEPISAVANPPIGRSSRRHKKYVIESKGYLHCLVLSLVAEQCVLDVYEMIDDKCWLVRPVSVAFRAGSIQEIEVLGFLRGDQVSMVVYHVPGKIIACRFGYGVCEEEIIVDFSRESYHQKGFLHFGFKESHHFLDSFAPL